MSWLVVALIVLVGIVVIGVCFGATDDTLNYPGLWYDEAYATNDKGEIIALLPCSYCRKPSEEPQCPYCGAGENRRDKR